MAFPPSTPGLPVGMRSSMSFLSANSENELPIISSWLHEKPDSTVSTSRSR